MAETRSWKDYSGLPKPLRCSHEEHYQYDTAVDACRKELTTSTGADTSLQQGKTTTTIRKGSWKEEHTQGEVGRGLYTEQINTSSLGVTYFPLLAHG